MDLIKRISWLSICYSLAEVALGICLFCEPNATLLTICYILAGLVIFGGVCSILNYFFYGFEPFGFIKGVVQIAFGIILFPLANIIVSPNVFAAIVGSVMLISGLLKTQNGMDARRAHAKEWWIFFIYGIVITALSIVMLCNTTVSQQIFLIILGIILIIDAIFDIAVTISVNSKINKIKVDYTIE